MNLQNHKPQTYRIRICILITTLCTAAFDKGWSKEGLDWWDFFPVRYLEASSHFVGNSQLEAFFKHINQINSRFELMRGLVMNAQRQLFPLPHRAKVQKRKLPCIRKQEVGQTYSQFTLTARDSPLWLSGGGALLKHCQVVGYGLKTVSPNSCTPGSYENSGSISHWFKDAFWKPPPPFL